MRWFCWRIWLPSVQQLYDVVYEQENYPFIPHKLKNIMAIKVTMPRLSWYYDGRNGSDLIKKVGDK
jgi:hypothetical protein